MRCKFYSILLYVFLLCLPIQAWGFDKALNQFKNEVSDAIEEFEKNLKKLKKSNLDIAKSLDAANEEFEDLIKFAEETLNNDEIHATIDAIEFLSSNIDAAIKIIPPETLTSMEEVDFTVFKEEEMTILSDIMTDMNRKKMDDFKEMVTSMVILEKQGFEAELFMQEMQDLEMGLTMLNDDSMQLEFDVAGLGNKSLDEVSKDLDTFDNNFQNLKAQKLIEKVANLSNSVEKNTEKVQTKVDNVSSNVGNKVNVETVQQGAEEITFSVKQDEVPKLDVKITVEFEGDVDTSAVTESTETVAEVVETSQVAESVAETAKEVEKVAYSFSSSTQTLNFSADELSNAQLALINSGLLNVANSTDKSWDMDFHNVNGGIDALQNTHGLLTMDDINSLQNDLKNHVLDMALSSGRFDMIDEKAQVQILCESGKADHNNKVNLSGTTGNIEGESRGDWDCNNL